MKRLIFIFVILASVAGAAEKQIDAVIPRRAYSNELADTVFDAGELVYIENDTNKPLTIGDGSTAGGSVLWSGEYIVQFLDGYIQTNDSGSVHICTAYGDNFAAGEGADGDNKTNCVVLGYYAGSGARGVDNFYGGPNAGLESSGKGNFYIGSVAGDSASGDYNYYGGLRAGQSSITTNSTFLGHFAGRNATGEDSVYIDAYASDPGWEYNPTNDNFVIRNGDLYLGRPTGNTHIRGTVDCAGYVETNHSGDVHIGTADGDNFVAGYNADGDNKTNCVVVGRYAGDSASGDKNFYGGYHAGHGASGDKNFYGGYHAGYSTSGENNFYGGYLAGHSASGDWNFYGGPRTGRNATNNHSTFIGHYAGRNATNDNSVYIDAYASDPGDSHDPTNDNFVIRNGDLYLGRPTGNTHIRGTVDCDDFVGKLNATDITPEYPRTENPAVSTNNNVGVGYFGGLSESTSTTRVEYLEWQTHDTTDQYKTALLKVRVPTTIESVSNLYVDLKANQTVEDMEMKSIANGSAVTVTNTLSAVDTAETFTIDISGLGLTAGQTLWIEAMPDGLSTTNSADTRYIGATKWQLSE